MTIRLEIHSDSMIPAGHWYKLITMEKEHYIKTDKEIRKKQRKFVHNPLYDKKAAIARNGQGGTADGKNGRIAAGQKSRRAAASGRSRVKAL